MRLPRSATALRRPALPLALAAGLAAAGPACAVDGPRTEVRAPAVAGQFYPADAGQLAAAVRAFLADARPTAPARPVAIVVPHAGYRFSGQIAADGWAQARGQSYDLLVLLGTNHTTAGFRGASVYTGAGMRTPLGVARVDTKAAAALRAAGGDFNADPRVHGREHSIEVQVPFAQVLFPGVPVLPVVVGSEDAAGCARIGRALARALAGRRPLLVASSDLSHYPDDAGSRASDHAVLAAIARLDPAGVQATMETQMNAGHRGLETCACGAGAVMAAMEAARALGATRGTVVSWANSGEVPPNDRQRVVGYGAVSFTAGGAPGGEHTGPGSAGAGGTGPGTPPPGAPDAADPGAPLDAGAKGALLRLARETLERWFETGGTVPLPRDLPAATRRPQGAFVTLFKAGELRGCIGHMAPDQPLAAMVQAMALAAAFEDPRFAPLAADELGDVEIEISVLTPLAPVAGPEAIVVGRDGVQIRKDGRTAVFLPQVAPEQGWDRTALLENLCRKAGLAADAWKSGAHFWTFQSLHFRESGTK
jgi:AmmeMemoRadiSam system protein B/AmmeMemoRadiSam system protein A